MSTALKKAPLARVKEEFGGKDKLVDKIVGVLDAGDESKDELRKRLLGVANTKLIRLHLVATKTKQAGGHDKLVATTAENGWARQGQGLRRQAGVLLERAPLDMLRRGGAPARGGRGQDRRRPPRRAAKAARGGKGPGGEAGGQGGEGARQKSAKAK